LSEKSKKQKCPYSVIIAEVRAGIA